MTEGDIVLAVFSVLVTTVGLAFHYRIWPLVTRDNDTWWLGSGPATQRHSVPGSAMTSFAVGGALLMAAPVLAITAAAADRQAASAPWIVVPQGAIGLVMFVRGWRSIRRSSPGPRTSYTILGVGIAWSVVPLAAWFVGLAALGQPLVISAIAALALGTVTTHIGPVALRVIVAIRAHPSEMPPPK